jgi:hypothetical protein
MHTHPHGIVVYPNRLKLLSLAALSALFFVAIFSLRDPANAQGDPRYYLAMFCGLPFFGFGSLFLLARALWPGPSLVINEDGIFDRISGGWRGVGLIPWSNIAGFDIETITYRFWKQRRLYIFLHDLTPESGAFLARSRWRGAIAGKMVRMTGRPHLLIIQTYLSIPIPDLLHEIERRYPAQLHEHHIVVVADG